MRTILTMVRGDTKKISVAALDEAGAPLDLNNMEDIFFTVKKKASDEDDDALIAKSVGSGIEVDSLLGGTATITLDPEDTATLEGYLRGLKWDVQIVMISGAVYTIASGLLSISTDITQRIA